MEITIHNAISNLSARDQIFCALEFARYHALISSRARADGLVILDMDTLRQEDPTVFPEGMEIMEKWNRHFILVANELTKAFIKKIEKHFRKNYGLEFSSILESNPSMESMSQITSYDLVIYNIFRQPKANQQYFGPMLN